MQIIDTTTPFGERAQRRLETDAIAWLVTVSARGVPVPVPVWFLPAGDDIIVYSQPAKAKLRNIGANPNVALHLDGDGRGGDIVVVTGTAEIDAGAPAADALPGYAEKYGSKIAGLGLDAAGFASAYSVPIRIRATGLRGH